MKYSVLLDTSFFIRLLNDEDKLHKNAKDYFRYFIENDIILKISTISIAEYCVVGKLSELPLRNIQIVPFNLEHAKKTGEFANIIFTANKIAKEKLHPRPIIPNDSKLFAQADLDKDIQYFVTSDKRSTDKTIKALTKEVVPNFKILDINISYNQFFGLLDM
ncbi:MAG: hypothetical protein U9Q83_07770 [Bacteroidota bacterium]|nr:hypothetical protein [Bacteroidota bacterium]